METINNLQLKQIHGGITKAGVAAIIAGVGVFIIGVFDGFIRPLKTLKRH